jgi:hypothetical protein
MRRMHGKGWTTAGRAGLAGLGLALALGAGCGGGDEVQYTPVTQDDPVEDEWVENTIPQIEWVRLEPEHPSPGGQVKALVRVVDADGDDIELGYAWRVNGRSVKAMEDTLDLAAAMKGDPLSVTVTASDGWDESEPVTVQTVLGNTSPIIESIVFDPLGDIHRGQPVTARPIAVDADGDRLDYEFTWWVNDRQLSSDDDLLDTTRLKRGDEVRVRVVATDGYSRSKPVMSDPILVSNSPPEIVSKAGNAGTGETYRYQVEARDPDGDRRLRFRLEEAPRGMTIDPISGLLTWTPPLDAVGSHPVEVVVDDLQGGQASQRFSVVISEEQAKEASPPDGDAVAGAAPPAAAEEDDR